MKYTTRKNAVLLLADGTVFYGKTVVEGTTIGEICFNTGMTGYQEIFTDPSYSGQIMVASTPHIGNYGVNAQEIESDSVKISGLVVKNFSFDFSRPNAESSLLEYLEKYNIVTISDIDTRALVSYIRDHGAMNAIISSEVEDMEALKAKLDAAPNMKGLELASTVSTKEPYFVGNPEAKYKVSALDLGVKMNILRNLAKRDCYIKVYPYNATLADLQDFNPDGYFLSNGPGDPEPLTQVQKVVKQVIATGKPVFGICLGHQIIALANGIPTFKMFNGHRGINHPIMNLLTGKGEITSQNHGFTVDREALDANADFELTHTHINDGTVAGMRMKDKPVFSVQYHPEASPGPHDSAYLFDQFISLMQEYK